MNVKEKESISRSFKKIKEEMLFLYNQMLDLGEQLSQIKSTLYDLSQEIQSQKVNPDTSSVGMQQKTKNPADNPPYNREISPISTFSIGNGGVPADSQQTVSRQPTHENPQESISSISQDSLDDEPQIPQIDLRYPKQESLKQEETRLPPGPKPEEIRLDNLPVILEKLKKDLKQKFKNLTNQEILVFSIIYTLNEEIPEVSYKDIALKANLTEGSIRDYVSRLEHKGIPLIKEKRNNKLVVIRIPDELKNITTLDNLTKLKK